MHYTVPTCLPTYLLHLPTYLSTCLSPTYLYLPSTYVHAC